MVCYYLTTNIQFFTNPIDSFQIHMDILKEGINLFLNMDIYLLSMVNKYQNWIYLVLFLIIFCETGLIVTPFLPGDSLLFTAGALAAMGAINIWLLVILLCIAAYLGDSVNYSIGKFLGVKVFEKKSRFIKEEYLTRTQNFYNKHGGKTIIFARFIPIIRTFAPFVAGISVMNYSRFIIFNLIGGILWVVVCTVSGYFFGNIPFVKENFSLVVLAIIFISLIPVLVEYLKYKLINSHSI